MISNKLSHAVHLKDLIATFRNHTGTVIRRGLSSFYSSAGRPLSQVFEYILLGYPAILSTAGDAIQFLEGYVFLCGNIPDQG